MLEHYRLHSSPFLSFWISASSPHLTYQFRWHIHPHLWWWICDDQVRPTPFTMWILEEWTCLDRLPPNSININLPLGMVCIYTSFHICNDGLHQWGWSMDEFWIHLVTCIHTITHRSFISFDPAFWLNPIGGPRVVPCRECVCRSHINHLGQIPHCVSHSPSYPSHNPCTIPSGHIEVLLSNRIWCI